MPRWFSQDRPVVFFDLETTGTDIENDRIVEIALVRLERDGREKEFSTRIRPGIPIPPEATAIHGISDADVASSPAFGDVADVILGHFADADCGGYNVRGFDLRMLAAEVTRAGRKFSSRGRRIFDPMAVFRWKHPRNLAAAYREYMGETLRGAHTALADCRAALEVFRRQFERHPDLPLEPDALHRVCNRVSPDSVDPDGVLGWRYREIIFRRGKHKGRTLESVARTDASYLEWMIESGIFFPEVLDVVAEALKSRKRGSDLSGGV